MNNKPMLLNLTKLSKTLGLNRNSIYRLLHSEQLPKAVYINNRRYWLLRDIELWLEKLKGKYR